MSALLDSMAQAFCGSDARREVLDAALRDGLPAARNEAWKYTSLRQLERRAFAAAPLQAPALDAALLDDIPAPRLVFVLQVQHGQLLPHQLEELHGIEFFFAARLALGVQCRAQEVGVVHARDFHRVLERQEQARGGTCFRVLLQQVDAVELHAAFGHFVAVAAGQDVTQCDSLLIGKQCGAHTFPYIEVKNPGATVEHEATTSKISDDQLFYCRARGISQEDAVSMIVDGFCKQVFRELPMEFAVEAKKLLEVSLEGSVG